MNKIIFKKYFTSLMAFTILILIFTPISKPISNAKEIIESTLKKPFELPDPLNLDILIEEKICLRFST